MAGILVALSNLFSADKESDVARKSTSTCTDLKNHIAVEEHDDGDASTGTLVPPVHNSEKTDFEVSTETSDSASDPLATAHKFPMKLFNIDIDSDFPPTEAFPLGTKKSSSEVSFLNDFIDPEDDDKRDANRNFPHLQEDAPEITEIIQNGVRDFQAEYLLKIEAAFERHVEHMTNIFRNGLEQACAGIENQLNAEMTIIRNDYKNRIAEFEASTSYYQNATEDVLEENRCQAEEMSATINTIQWRIEQKSMKLKSEMERKFKEVEQKLMEERSRATLEFHEKICAASNIESNGQWFLEEKLKRDAKGQEETIQAARLENEELEERIDIAEIHALAEYNRRENIRFMKEREHHDTLVRKRTLEKKVDILEKQNADLLEAHKIQIVQMNQLHDLRTEHYNSEFRYFKKLLMETRKTFQEDIAHFKESMKLQEEAHEAALESLHDAYREKLISLVDTVQELKSTTHALWQSNKTNSTPELTLTPQKILPEGLATPSDLTLKLQQLREEVSNANFSIEGADD